MFALVFCKMEKMQKTHELLCQRFHRDIQQGSFKRPKFTQHFLISYLCYQTTFYCQKTSIKLLTIEPPSKNSMRYFGCDGYKIGPLGPKTFIEISYQRSSGHFPKLSAFVDLNFWYKSAFGSGKKIPISKNKVWKLFTLLSFIKINLWYCGPGSGHLLSTFGPKNSSLGIKLRPTGPSE